MSFSPPEPLYGFFYVALAYDTVNLIVNFPDAEPTLRSQESSVSKLI